jgi:hypothetical protein
MRKLLYGVSIPCGFDFKRLEIVENVEHFSPDLLANQFGKNCYAVVNWDLVGIGQILATAREKKVKEIFVNLWNWCEEIKNTPKGRRYFLLASGVE